MSMSTKNNFLFSSECVTSGFPDKLCDQISDAIVDGFLQQDPFTRVTAETAMSKGVVFIATRYASSAEIDIPSVARDVIKQAGYVQGEFNANDCTIMTSLSQLPSELYLGQDESEMTDEQIGRITANSQVNAFGFACRQSPTLLPLPIWLAHKLSQQLTRARMERNIPYLMPDGKVQVSIEFQGRKPYRIHNIVLVSSQDPSFEYNEKKYQQDIMTYVIEPVFSDETIRPDSKTRILINPFGPFMTGGPALHSGSTGRKGSVDTYGEYSRQSSAALSGKDPLRIDRTGIYAARYAAKNIVAAGIAEECEVHLSYSMDQAEPASIEVECFGTGKLNEEVITNLLLENFDFRIGSIIKEFNMRYLPRKGSKGFYRQLAAYGHVGREDLDLPWEATGKLNK